MKSLLPKAVFIGGNPGRSRPTQAAAFAGGPHRRIGYIGGDQAFDVDYHVPSRRREGFQQALDAWGGSSCADLVHAADFTIAGGYHAAKQLLGLPSSGMTSIVAASDDMAIGALLAAKDLGRTPGVRACSAWQHGDDHHTH